MKELLGIGIVEPVDDWDTARPSHKELLQWLAHDFITHGYDLKHLARTIVTSEAYQRAATSAGSRAGKPDERLFASPARRRLTAEQIVDSLFALAGKQFEAEPLNMDPEARQSTKDFVDLGVAKRSWQLVGLSNERDRPALAKPRAQVITDALATFGWRESRQDPRGTRDHDANVLQPALLANGLLTARITRLSDDSAFTAVALEDQPLEQLVDRLYLRVLSRPPTSEEHASFVALLSPGYADRVVPNAPLTPPRPAPTKIVSWANHLPPEATEIAQAAEREVKAGDPPTARLLSGWRERLEDAVWALIVSPEFIYLP